MNNNKQDLFKTQSCVLRVNIHCDGCRSKVKKILQKIDGVYTISIDAEQGKVTVTGTVDPSTLIKKLEKNGKYAQLWGPPPSSKASSNHQFMNNLNNQFKNLSFDAGPKMVKDNKSHNGGKIVQPQQGLHQQQQQLMQLQQQQMSKGGKDGKAGKFSMPDDEEFDDDDGEFDDDFDDDEFDDGEFDDEEFDDDVLYAKHPPSKNAPMMGNVNVHVPKGGSGGGGGGGDKKGKGGDGGGDEKKKGGGGGMAGLIKGMLGGGGAGKGWDGKKGKDGKKDGKSGGKDKGGHNNHVQNGGKNGSEGKKGEGKMGKEENSKGGLPKGGGQNGNSGKGNGNGGKNKGGGGGGGGGFKEIDGMSSHNKSGGPNMSMMGQMGNYPMGSNMPSIPGLPAGVQPMMNGSGPPMMNGGGGGGGSGYYPGMGMGMGQGGSVGASPGQFNNPQQQYMAMMMNQQRMNGGGDGYGGGMYQPQPMMYGRQPMGLGYAPPMVPPPGYHDPYTSYYSDENHESCSIM